MSKLMLQKHLLLSIALSAQCRHCWTTGTVKSKTLTSLWQSTLNLVSFMSSNVMHRYGMNLDIDIQGENRKFTEWTDCTAIPFWVHSMPCNPALHLGHWTNFCQCLAVFCTFVTCAKIKEKHEMLMITFNMSNQFVFIFLSFQIQ